MAMRILVSGSSKAYMRFFAVLTALLCSVLFIRSITADSESSENTQVIMIRYGGIGSKEGQVSQQQIEQDIRYLNNKGYSPVFASELADNIKGEALLPHKAVVLTFDGGSSQYYSKLMPILAKYRFKAVVTVYGLQTEYASNSADDNAENLRWDQIKEMDASGLIEFSNGSYSLLDNGGSAQKADETYEQFRSRFISDVGQLQALFQENCGFEPCVFTFPDGRSDDKTARLVKNLGFQAAMSLERGCVRTKGKNKADPYRLKRYERAEAESIRELLEQQ